MDREAKKSPWKASGLGLLGAVYPTGDRWGYSVRSIFLAPRDYRAKERQRETTRPTRRNVAAAVTRFARYPAGMLTGDPGRLRDLMEARGNFRLLRFAGAFRGSSGPSATTSGESTDGDVA